jgi:rSAM/selenodomain-associated transferase 2
VTITVVIPTLNEEQLLATTLRQVAGLGFDEILVVDGGSSDRTQAIVERFASGASGLIDSAPPISLLTASTGRARQMNAGAAAARSDVLLFLHADTTLPEQARRAIQQALDEPACVGGRFDVRFEEAGTLSRLVGRMMNVRSRVTGIATGDQALFVRRRVFEQLGGFADIPLMEDIEFSRRLKRIGRIAALDLHAVTSYRRWNTGGPWRTILLMWMLRALFWLGISPHKLRHLYGTIR